MPQAIGSKLSIGFTTETTYGTFIAPADSAHNRAKRAAVNPRGEQTSGNVNMGIPWASAQRVHRKRSSGEIAMDLSYQGFERYFLHMFGLLSDVATNGSGADAGAWTHVFTPKISQVVGGSLRVNADILRMDYPGQKISGMRFNFRRNDPLEMLLTVIGLPHTTPNPPVAPVATPTFLEEVVTAGNNAIPCINPIETGAFGFVFAIGDAGGTNYVNVGIIEGDFGIDKPHQEDRGNIGVATIAEPIANGQPLMTFTGSLRKEFLDSTLITPFIDGIQKAFRWTYQSPNLVRTAGAALRYKWELEARYVRWLETPPQISGAGPIEDTIPFICESPDGTTAPVTLTLINGLANAAT